MTPFLLNQDVLKRFRTHSIIAGILLIILGLIGIFLPTLMSFTVSLSIAWILIVGGLISGYHVIKSYHKRWLAWLKPFILLLTGILFLIYPVTGVEAIGLLIAFYFFMDAFAGFSSAFELRHLKSWTWMLFNGLLSLILALIFSIGWPFNSLWLVGLFVGISLFMDGFVVLIMGISARSK